MNETNKSLRIRTNVGTDKYVSVNLTSEYDTLEILSLKINQRGAYRYHTNTYGVVVGRVLANNGFGIPNAKLSLFIAKDENADIIESALYPYTTVGSKNSEGVRYNLLPSNQKDDCHQVVGTFPSKRMVLDDATVIEVFDKYYIYTTRSNESGDYMFYGVPTGTYTLHMDLDLSDCGKLSQRPRDFVYKGYNLDQFENPNQFKEDTELAMLPQIFTQDVTVNVKPFWGDEKEGTEIGITREDINVRYTFEPTCVFMGSIVSDTPNDGINKRCVPSNKMGDMREMVTGSGTIEIIRKTVNGTIEELQIKGKQLIDNNGVWCFQIPMNLDYITTDEYGNTVPTDNPDKGIPTRCEVRFRFSMDETEAETLMYKRGKMLVPNNPDKYDDTDYEFGSKTKDESFKSLMWNGVYSVKSFIPRFQKSVDVNVNKFTGIKNVNIHGGNNPMPYNNIRIKIPFMFWLMCNIIKLFIRIIKVINNLKVGLMNLGLGLINLPYAYIGNEVCPDLEYWYFAPGMNTDGPSDTWLRKFWKWLSGKDDSKCKKWQHESTCLTFREIANTLKGTDGSNELSYVYQYIGDGNDKLPHVLSYDEIVELMGDDVSKIRDINEINEAPNSSGNVENDYKNPKYWAKAPTASAPMDKMSTEVRNMVNKNNPRIHLTPDVDYLMQCVEMNLAQEYEVIKFDFYNDWINGTIYLPRWSREVRYKKKRKNGKKEVITKVKGCIDNKNRNRVARKYMQQCSLIYDKKLNLLSPAGCSWDDKLKCHKSNGSHFVSVLGKNGGVVHEHETILGDNVYYMKPMDNKALMFATDIIMLGSLFDCNEYGIPSTFESLVSTSYKLPSNLATTNVNEDSYSYLDNSEVTYESGPPTRDDVMKWKCGEDCTLQYIAESGATATIPSYEDIRDMMVERGDLLSGDTTEGNIVIEYDDIFPVTELSGIEWGYRGPEFENANQTYDISDSGDKLFSPGGHFMGLACGSAETNIKSCVNLKRACEIGTTLSERLEIPIGFKDNPNAIDEVNYLYVAPNGVIAKDQVVDVTFRSAFATMNQNSLRTIVDPVTNHKKYDFVYLVPDTFDGSIEGVLTKNNNKYPYNKRIPLEWDNYWSKVGENRIPQEMIDEIAYEQGYTISRLYDTTSEDYIAFRHGTNDLDEKCFLKKLQNDGFSMPIYRNSFYFYFGLKEGATALDEFRKQFFASCAKTSIVSKQAYIDYDIQWVNTGFTYDITITTYNMTMPLMYTITKDGHTIEKVESYRTDIINFNGYQIGEYELTIVDGDDETFFETIINNDFSVNYDITSVVNYLQEDKREFLSEFEKNDDNGGYISGDFSINIPEKIPNSLSYKVHIRRYKSDNEYLEIVSGSEEWDKLYDAENKVLWLFGAGEYEVWVIEYQNGEENGGEYLHSRFTVKNGKPLPKIRIGVYDYFDDNGGTVFENFELSHAKEDSWTDYEKYRTIVNVAKVGNPFYLNFNCGNEEGFEDIYAGRREEDYGVGEEIEFNTVIDFSNINYPSDYPTLTSKIDRGNFYYTAINGSVFATPSQKFESKNGIVTVKLKEKGVYCLINGTYKQVREIDDDSKLNFQISSSNDIICSRMCSCPVYFNPFAFRCVLSSLNGKINTDFKQFDVQSYKEKVNIEINDDTIVFTDCKDAISRVTESFDIPYFGSMKLKYQNGSGVNGGNSYTFRINGLNQNLSDDKTSYFLCSPSVTNLSFNSKGEFLKDINDSNFESSLSTNTIMTVSMDEGDKIAQCTPGSINVSGARIWAFGKTIESRGDKGQNIYDNDYRECTVVNPTNVLTFSESKTLLFDGIQIVNEYVENSDGYVIYEEDFNGNIVEMPNDSFESLQLKVTISNSLSTSLDANDQNPYRFGNIYFNIRENKDGYFPRITEYTGQYLYFTNEEIENTNKIYSIFFNYGDGVKMDSTLKEGVNSDIKDLFKIVIVAKDSEGNIICHKEYSDGVELTFSYKEFRSINQFEILYVYNYGISNNS